MKAKQPDAVKVTGKEATLHRFAPRPAASEAEKIAIVLKSLNPYGDVLDEWLEKSRLDTAREFVRVFDADGTMSLETFARRLEDLYSGRLNRKPPSSEAAAKPPLRMRDDFNIAIKQARTEVLARMLDVDNPALSEKERLTRARRVKASFERRRAEDPDFPASPEVQKAVSIVNRDNYRRATARKAKAKLAM
jgi:hypothetical protein